LDTKKTKAKEARRVTHCMRSAPWRALRGSCRLGQSVATLPRSHASTHPHCGWLC